MRSVKNGGKTHYFSYDANGNLTYGPDLTDSSSVGWRSLSWTAENRPSEIKYKDKKTVPLTIRFEYDGEGRRTVKTVSVPTLSTGGNINPKAVSTTVYVNDAFQVSNGKAVVHLFAGTVRIAEVRSGSVLYHHKDHLGSATVLTGKNGNRVETAEYLPFGELRESTGSWTTDYKFTDHELDTETGLYNFNARLYDPAVGRFISPDPAVPDLSGSTNPRNYDPQMFNRYAYCRNNPLIYIDPSGLEDDDIGGILGGYLDGTDEDHSEETSWGSIPLQGGPSYMDCIVAGPERSLRDVYRLSDKISLFDSLRMPDYLSANFNLAIVNPWTGTLFGWSGTFQIDRHGGWHWSAFGAGFGKSATFVSGSITANWMNQSSEPGMDQLNNFLSGNAYNFTAGVWGGISESWLPGMVSSTGLGFVSPQIGISYNYSLQGGQNTGVTW